MQKKIEAIARSTGANKSICMLSHYEECFENLTGKEIKLLELGVQKGGSLLLWRDYFETGTIVGLDINPCDLDDPSGRVRVYQGSQLDTDLLDRIAEKEATEGFDIIIDDCSHIGQFSRTSFWHLFENHLKPGGIYAIEDWGTGYMGQWVDGRRYRSGGHNAYSSFHSLKYSLVARLIAFASKLPKLFMIISMSGRIPSHMHGMAGFVKELIDACCLGEIASPRRGSGPWRAYKIYRMNVFWNHVIVMKSHHPETYTDDGSEGRVMRKS